MFFPFKTKAPTASAQTGPVLSDSSSEKARCDELSAEIQALTSDKAAVSILNRSDSIAALLRPAARTLRRKTYAMLEAIVNIWVEQTHPLMNIAEMFRDMKLLEDRSQSIAAAMEEMTASVKELARSSEAVAEDAENVKSELTIGVEQTGHALTSMEEISSAFGTMREKVQTLDKASEQIASILRPSKKSPRRRIF